jgi:cyanophycin synthetase
MSVRLYPFFNRYLDFYWKKKRTLLRSARRRGFDLKLTPRVPTAGITGSVGKTTTCRMLAHILTCMGLRVALSTTQGAYVGRETLKSGDMAGGESAGRLLTDPRVQAGVFELARGGLISDGMVLSSVDVGAVLNVYDNHIGLDGVNSREGLARVKAEVVRRARKLAVLNADDPLCVEMRRHVRAPRLCFVSECPDSPVVAAHMAQGGPVMLLRGAGPDRRMELHEGGSMLGTLDVREIPATYGGIFRPAVMNAAFAASMAHGLGVGWDAVARALCVFQSTPESNPGRMNFLQGFPFDVLLTWADGPQAMSGLADFLRRYPAGGRRHLMINNVGNRPDEFILGMTRTVAGLFDSYICADWSDLRGRKPGEVAELLARGLLEDGVAEARVSVVPGYHASLHAAFQRPAPGDFLVVVNSDDVVLEVAEGYREADRAFADNGFMEGI